VSCFDVTRTAPAPALSTGGLLVAALLITAIGWLALARRPRHG